MRAERRLEWSCNEPGLTKGTRGHQKLGDIWGCPFCCPKKLRDSMGTTLWTP